MVLPRERKYYSSWHFIRTVAEAVTEEVLANFKMFHEAGLSDFSFMRRIRSLEDLRSRLLVSGKETGAGQVKYYYHNLTNHFISHHSVYGPMSLR